MADEFRIAVYYGTAAPGAPASVEMVWDGVDPPSVEDVTTILATLIGPVQEPAEFSARLVPPDGDGPGGIYPLADAVLTPPDTGRPFRAGTLLTAGCRVASDDQAEVWPIEQLAFRDAGAVGICHGVTLEQVPCGRVMEYLPNGEGLGSWREKR